MWSPRPRIVDHRGQPGRLASATTRAGRLWWFLRVELCVAAWAAWIATVLTPVLAFAIWVEPWVLYRLGFPIQLPIEERYDRTVVAGVAAISLALWAGRGWLARAVARDCVKAGACATCGYAMAGLPVTDDGCAVCPECGAAWRHNGR